MLNTTLYDYMCYLEYMFTNTTKSTAYGTCKRRACTALIRHSAATLLSRPAAPCHSGLTFL